MNNLHMHLTNYAINKTNKSYEKNKESESDDVGHKRSLKFTLKLLESLGHDVDMVLKDIH